MSQTSGTGFWTCEFSNVMPAYVALVENAAGFIRTPMVDTRLALALKHAAILRTFGTFHHEGAGILPIADE